MNVTVWGLLASLILAISAVVLADQAAVTAVGRDGDKILVDVVC
jgi:hypothetical protein